jgi:flagellar assembly factor FliW
MTSCAAPAYAMTDPTLTIPSEVLGPVTVAPADVITFEHGVLGFPACRQFVLLPAGREGLYWLQSAEHSALTFLLADPFTLVPGYTLDLGATEGGEALAGASPPDVVALVILTLPATRAEPPTANLQGPVVIDLRTRQGRQVVVTSGEYDLRHPVDLSQKLVG